MRKSRSQKKSDTFQDGIPMVHVFDTRLFFIVIPWYVEYHKESKSQRLQMKDFPFESKRIVQEINST